MEVVPQFIVNILIPASLYGMVAVGFSVVVRVTRMYHLAIGGLVLFSGYLLYSSRLAGMPWWLGIIIAILITTFIGWFMGVAVFERFQEKRSVRVGSSVVAALALLVFLENGLLMYFGPGSKSVAHVWDVHHAVGSAIVTDLEIVIVVVSMLVSGMVWLFLHATRFGKALRAIADNAEVAAVVGIDLQKGRGFAWALAAFLAGIAGIFYALEYTLIPAQASAMAINVFFRSILGGVGSVPGALAGSLLLETAEQATALWISSTFKFLTAAVMVVAVLLWRPSGIFGIKK
ncbi:hypothetical protein A3I42_00420 [Candidatus Uhrbacteria bacterium RIFCSPLOWO2_02_FULL_49_11]|uniref:Branched-chain amino acid ABC transporter permease n=1 Tax=Candidatus Uhrbacteria bacterium RIFCSPLOWO2_02_FULL_49_11 TaxID=1802409 RepID=A0A1F7VCU5_9BACT|nr:MAG: hypothetical protein A3I42_00420 [Candidatus Uhrbacteria bacterium RIFCSPLOWO2_02_FULL_49_11]